MDPRKSLVSAAAIADALEVAESRQGFDEYAAQSFLREFPAMVDTLCLFPESGREVGTREGFAIRLWVYKSTSVLYHVENDTIVIDRVFGPGRDWKAKL